MIWVTLTDKMVPRVAVHLCSLYIFMLFLTTHNLVTYYVGGNFTANLCKVYNRCTLI